MKDYSFLLNRAEHVFPEPEICQAFRNLRVMVTGAGGSIGSEICRQLCSSGVKFLGAFGHSELPIFNLKKELPEQVDYRIADIRNYDSVKEIVRSWNPDVVIHAAAHKHVGLMETQPKEAFANNVEGTICLATATRHVKRVVFISTDKAAKPTSVMGASKRLAEYWLMANRANVSVVRFGNVLGSSGSLVDILEKSYCMKVTHQDMERFFISRREATGLVLTVASLLPFGVYTLDMGKQIKIVDIIQRFAGVRNEAIDITVTQPGPGEKISEDILNTTERLESSIYPGIFQITGQYYSDEIWQNAVDMFWRGRCSLVDAANML